MKKVIIGAILIVGLAAGFAFAHGGGWGGGYGGHMMGPGYGGHMMGPGYGGHMMGPGYGGRMMGPGYGDQMMGPGYGGQMMGPGYGGGYNCPGAAYFGQDGWNSEGHQKFLEDTVDLRKELNDKRFEYWEAQRNPKADRDRVATLEKEIIELQQQLREKAQQY